MVTGRFLGGTYSLLKESCVKISARYEHLPIFVMNKKNCFLHDWVSCNNIKRAYVAIILDY